MKANKNDFPCKFFFFQANLDPVPNGGSWIWTRISTYVDPLYYWQCSVFYILLINFFGYLSSLIPTRHSYGFSSF